MIQNIIVLTIVAACVLYIGKYIYSTLLSNKKSPCEQCGGCALKNKIDSCNKK